MANERLEKARKSFLVIGLGYFGEAIATRLYELGQEVVGVDTDPDIVQRLANKLTQAIELDGTDEEALATLGVRNFDVCIVGRGSNLEDSVTITMNLKDQGSRYIIAKAMRAKHAKILEQLQTDLIVFPEIDMAHQIAENLVHPKIVGEVQLGSGYVVEAVKPPNRLVGKPISNIPSLLPVGVKFLGLHRGDELISLPDEKKTISSVDLVIVWGRSNRIAELEK
ncbi:MAG: TrkA family potassium uptake protein [Armatimonadetes bacterium]|nr:TrkA family potassium uptake protein [Armatimonadota bacterium]